MRPPSALTCDNLSQHKPHIPWTVPQEFYDRYPLDEVALAPHPSRPSGTPAVALNNILSGYWSSAFTDFGALRANGSITKMNPDDNTTLDAYWNRRARQAYWGAISFTDVNVGQVLGAAKTAGLYDDAIVIFWGDHGVSQLKIA
jgi:iduronate 2-sulfatase